MAVRTSEGRFLEILEPAGAVGLPLEFDVFDGANPATMLATLHSGFDGAFQEEISEVGSGRISLLRSDAKATASILAKGNLVKVKTGGIERGAFWIEEPTERLTSVREASGEIVTVKGRGALAYIERGAVYPPVWPSVPVGFRSASSGSNSPSAATTVSCPKPAGMQNGDLMIAAVAFVGGSSKSLTPPTGWREFRRINEGVVGIALYRKTAGSTEPASYKWAFTTASQASVNILAFSSASQDFTEYAFASTSAGSGTSIRHPSVSVEVVDGTLITFAAASNGTDITPPVGYTEAAQNIWASSAIVLEGAYSLGPALGDTGEKTSTNTNSATWIGVHLYVPSTATNDASFSGETFGAILATLIDRAQARGALLDLAYDFTATADSQGNPWPDVFDLTFHAGTSLLDVWRHLVSLGLEGRMTHDLRLQAYVDMSRAKQGDVILRKGMHFLGDVENSGHFAGLRTRFLVEGAGGRLVEVINPTLEADPRIGRREGFLAMGTSDTATDLFRAGDQALQISALEDQARSVPVDHGLLEDGRYEPWADYRIGDYIAIDPDGTGIVSDERVVGITVAHRDSLDYSVVLDMNSVSLEASVRMKRQLDALARTSSPGGLGSTGLSLGGGSAPGGGPAASGKVSAADGDTSGYLYDKIDVTSPLAKALGGVTGNRTVALSVGTGTKDGTKFLRDDGVWTPLPGVPVLARKTADENTSSTGFIDSAGLSLPIEANTWYRFRFVLFLTSNATTVGVKIGLNGPTISSLRWGLILPTAAPSQSVAHLNAVSTSYNAEALAATAGPGTAGSMAIVEGVIRCTASGNLVLRHASETATQTTILGLSYGELVAFA